MKVGHRQASNKENPRPAAGGFFLYRIFYRVLIAAAVVTRVPIAVADWIP